MAAHEGELDGGWAADEGEGAGGNVAKQGADAEAAELGRLAVAAEPPVYGDGIESTADVGGIEGGGQARGRRVGQAGINRVERAADAVAVDAHAHALAGGHPGAQAALQQRHLGRVIPTLGSGGGEGARELREAPAVGSFGNRFSSADERKWVTMGVRLPPLWRKGAGYSPAYTCCRLSRARNGRGPWVQLAVRRRGRRQEAQLVHVQPAQARAQRQRRFAAAVGQFAGAAVAATALDQGAASRQQPGIGHTIRRRRQRRGRRAWLRRPGQRLEPAAERQRVPGIARAEHGRREARGGVAVGPD